MGRVSSWTAKACKGRVQVYSSDYADALTTLRDVRDSGPYALEDGFHQDWTGLKDFANGPEAILVYQASVNNGNPNGDNGNWGERLNFPHGGSPFGCCGFHQPSQNLVNFFRVDADGLPLALTDATWNASDANFDTTATAPVDPRLDWSVGPDGVPFKEWPSNPDVDGIHEPSWIHDLAWGAVQSAKKNVHEFNSGAQSNVGWNAQHINSVNTGHQSGQHSRIHRRSFDHLGGLRDRQVPGALDGSTNGPDGRPLRAQAPAGRWKAIGSST